MSSLGPSFEESFRDTRVEAVTPKMCQMFDILKSLHYQLCGIALDLCMPLTPTTKVDKLCTSEAIELRLFDAQNMTLAITWAIWLALIT